MDPILDAIDEALKRKGLSDSAASKLAVGNFALIKNMRSSRSEEKRYNYQALEKLAEVLGLECYFGPPRSTGPVETVILGNEDFAPIPRLDARVSAGPGAENGDVQVIEKLAFRRDWLDRMGVDPTQAVLVQVSGDSMTPGLHDGDLALIDRRRNKVRNGYVYALTDTDGSTRVKRIEMLANGLILRSDAPSYPTEFRPCDDANRVNIIGQVVWSGHTW
ncbi:S24 family peptidase [Rhodobacter capsulatus]|uniref:S24 family peptidase n=1 Tax=Rhodobacter capsulatus TaxID=1061 RepID=UPI0003D30B2A|nr:S24 family peptidase [Rhodobacter capsulatus]ETD85719.1 repressor [Rhodobacter capsulatus YW1]